MATDTLTTEVPRPPPWLNLSAILDDDLIRRVAAAAVEMERVVDEVLPLIENARSLIEAVDEAMSRQDMPKRASDGVYEAVRVYSGADRLHNAVLRLDGAVDDSGLN